MTKVKLRKKSMTDNRHSLYLDYYPPIPNEETGKPTRREFLKLFIYDKPKNPFEKEHNKNTMALAEAIKGQRQSSIQNQNYGFISNPSEKGDFVEYFRQLAAKRKGPNSDNWQSSLKYLVAFTGGKLPFKDLTLKMCDDFREYLQSSPTNRSSKKTLAQNSAHSYFNKFKAALKQAYKEGHLKTDLNGRVDGIKQAETNRQFLTLEELNKLANTDCELPQLKQAALFSALTGLRYSDIEKLLWSEIQYSQESGFSIRFRQKKTKGMEVLPISEQAVSLLGERGEPEKRIFSGLVYSAWTNLKLREWILDSGIKKKGITFHSFRHTYATLQLELGTDIYTLSKMLGHRDLKTTQIYAKIVDKTKQQAANRIKIDFI
ncbi:site-specific integrase [Telluribacter sp. SYSU D00476]|uniref:site-specific integrase n=1 Tax=Telluribacter sp. SYSU D00476 TaxID=2811430 RepID=UPI001FF13CCA|nr:site-specific integrase [Telluribacter sp. SYSU D00476]